jgi:MFS family permease
MNNGFNRDRFFWVVAVQTAIVNFYLGGFGPAQSLLRADQGTSLTIAGLHGTAMGVASIIAGWANPRIAHKYGRNRASWIGLTIFITGLTLFVISPPVYLTLPATFITGFGTSVVINTMLTKMSSHYGKAAEVAIPQANGIASVGFVTGTALIGTIAIAYPGLWRFEIKMPMIMSLMSMDRKAESSLKSFGSRGLALLPVFQVSLQHHSGPQHF